jgi:hypothetical protein
MTLESYGHISRAIRRIEWYGLISSLIRANPGKKKKNYGSRFIVAACRGGAGGSEQIENGIAVVKQAKAIVFVNSLLKSINAHPRRFDEPLRDRLHPRKVTPSTRKLLLQDPARGLWRRPR